MNTLLKDLVCNLGIWTVTTILLLIQFPTLHLRCRHNIVIVQLNVSKDLPLFLDSKILSPLTHNQKKYIFSGNKPDTISVRWLLRESEAASSQGNNEHITSTTWSSQQQEDSAYFTFSRKYGQWISSCWGNCRYPQLEEKQAFLATVEHAVECRQERNLMSWFSLGKSERCLYLGLLNSPKALSC